jgi:hypothetical protein
MFRKIKLKIKQIMNAIAREIEKYASPISKIVAPIAKGMKSKKENFVARSFGIPEKREAEIVIPLLEIPGNKARTWNKPINKEFFQFSLEDFTGIFVSNRIAPVKRKDIPIKRKEFRADSMKFLKKNPKRAAGRVAIIK